MDHFIFGQGKKTVLWVRLRCEALTEFIGIGIGVFQHYIASVQSNSARKVGVATFHSSQICTNGSCNIPFFTEKKEEGRQKNQQEKAN